SITIRIIRGEESAELAVSVPVRAPLQLIAPTDGNMHGMRTATVALPDWFPRMSNDVTYFGVWASGPRPPEYGNYNSTDPVGDTGGQIQIPFAIGVQTGTWRLYLKYLVHS